VDYEEVYNFGGKIAGYGEDDYPDIDLTDIDWKFKRDDLEFEIIVSCPFFDCPKQQCDYFVGIKFDYEITVEEMRELTTISEKDWYLELTTFIKEQFGKTVQPKIIATPHIW
jgi:hypothetical protein